MSAATTSEPRPSADASVGEGAPPVPAVDTYPRGLYLHVLVVSLVGGFAVLGWFVLYEWLNKLIWENAYVVAHAWMFPVVCLPFSLLVGLLVKCARAPSNLDGSMLDSLTGDVSTLRWKDLPATVATSLASLFSGAVLGPEGAIGNIAGKIAALYCDPAHPPTGGLGWCSPAWPPATTASSRTRSSPPCSAPRWRRPEAGPGHPAGEPHRRRRRLRHLQGAARERVPGVPPPAAGAELPGGTRFSWRRWRWPAWSLRS